MAVDEGIFQNIVAVNWPSDPVLIEWDSGNGTASWWGVDFDDVARTLSQLAKTWNGSLGGGPEDFSLVPDASLADSQYLGAKGFGGSETEFGGSNWAKNGHNWGPYWDDTGTLIPFSARPATGYFLKWGLTPNRFWRGGLVSLPDWSDYRVYFRLPTPAEFDPPATYSIQLGNSSLGGTLETHSFSAEFPDSARDDMVSLINSTSVLASATSDTDPRDMYIESLTSGYPLLPAIPGGSAVTKLEGSFLPTISTAGPVLNWTTITETVTL